MKIWKILSPKVLTAEERPDNITTENAGEGQSDQTAVF